MDWQLMVVVLIVAVAAAYLGRREWRTWAGRKAGCAGCGCGPAATSPQGQVTVIPAGQLRLRRREAEH